MSNYSCKASNTPLAGRKREARRRPKRSDGGWRIKRSCKGSKSSRSVRNRRRENRRCLTGRCRYFFWGRSTVRARAPCLPWQWRPSGRDGRRAGPRLTPPARRRRRRFSADGGSPLAFLYRMTPFSAVIPAEEGFRKAGEPMDEGGSGPPFQLPLAIWRAAYYNRRIGDRPVCDLPGGTAQKKDKGI